MDEHMTLAPGAARAADTALRVAVIEDDPDVRAHLEAAMAGADGFAVGPGAATRREALALVDDLPDIALVDLGLPDGDGADAIRALKAAGDVVCVVVTVFDDRASVVRAFECGADGYVLKSAPNGAVLDAVKAALAGGTPISPAAATHLVDWFFARSGSEVDDAEPGPSLTKKETELLHLFAKGLSYREAAEGMGISPHTVAAHVKAIYRKLAVNSRAEAVYEAMRGRIITLDDRDATR